ncbi:hypothetical protein AYO44_17525 [Planctomycetaceae bacterium SCGC AG-212-F19]|nr:hypothetical protein AYO44_17525 [Planctomycetaceae bacterium SCGC AG-212-F19]
MTEADWLACTDPQKMLEFLRGKASDRKLRLFAVACCREFVNFPSHGLDPKPIELGERCADGLATDADRTAAFESIQMQKENAVFEQQFERAAWLLAIQSMVFTNIWDGIGYTPGWSTPAWHYPKKCHLLRDIFVSLFHAVTIERLWLTSNVVALAETIYDERAFERMPILADALEDAGCTNAEVLNHCRSGGEHVRGCWVVDLVLGKG